MRPHHACRSCLLRLAQASAHRPRCSRARLHAQVASPGEDCSLLMWTRARHGVSDALPDGLHSNPDPRYPLQQQLAVSSQNGSSRYQKPPKIHKDFGLSNHVGQAGSVTPMSRLKSKILRTEGDFNLRDFDLLLPDIMEAFYMPRRAAHITVAQLKRLFRGRLRKKAADLLTELQSWKAKYVAVEQEITGSSTANIPSEAVPDRDKWAVFAEGMTLSRDSVKNAWLQLDESERQRHWPDIMLSVLHANPQALPIFLEATYDSAWSQPYIAEDMVRFLLLHKSLQSTASMDNLAHLVLFLYRSDPRGHFQLDNDTLYRLANRATPAQAAEIYTVAGKSQTLSSHTQLHFASRLARSMEYKHMAVDILCFLAMSRKFDLNSPAAASVCTAVVSSNGEKGLPQGLASPDQLLKRLLEHGLRPNLLTLTALMRNFCIQGHLEPAWAILDLLQEHGTEPDAHVYSILLAASKRQFNVASTRRVLSMVHAKRLWTPAIIHDVLDFIYKDNEMQTERRRRQRKANHAYQPMLTVYAKFFRLGPLQTLIRIPLEYRLGWQGPIAKRITGVTNLAAALTPQPEKLLMEPETTTLMLMLQAYLRQIDNPEGMRRAYEHIRHLIDTHDPIASKLLHEQGSALFDMLIRGLLQFQATSTVATGLVRDMLGRSQLGQERKLYPVPTLYTWTSLINGMKNHKQAQLAMSMFQMMKDTGGVEPNLVAWNALLGAFTRAGDVRGAVRVMQMMEATGLKADEYTIKCFSRLPPRLRADAVKLMEAYKKDGANSRPIEPVGTPCNL